MGQGMPFRRSMHYKVLLIQAVLVLCLGSFVVPAKAQRYFFENVAVQQGLASKVYTALQDPYGMIWIGTETGLSSYDGNVVVNYGTQDGLAANGVPALCMDKDGALWIGHLDGGLSYYDGHQFRALTVATSMQSDITGIVQANDGSIWLSTAGQGAFRVEGAPDESGALKVQQFEEAAGLRKVLRGVVRLQDDRLCFVQDAGTIRAYDPGSKQFTVLDLPGVTDVFKIITLFQDSRKALWVGTNEGGAFQFDAEGKLTSRYDPSNGLASGMVFTFGEDVEGRIWAGTMDKGVCLFEKNRVRTFNKSNGLHSDFVRCIVRDREGNLLIGTNDSGLDIFKGDRFVSFGEADGLSDPQVFAVTEDSQGRTWFGTNGGIVIISGKEGGGVAQTITSQQGTLTTNFIRCLREDDKGFMWIGTHNGGLIRYDPRSGKAVYDIELSAGLGDSRVTALEVGQSGELWVGGVNGLRRYLPGSGTVPTIYNEENGLAGNNIVSVYRDPKGSIWVGSLAKGVTRIDNGQAQRLDLGRLFTPTAFVQDLEGRIWVGTEGQGILVLKNGKVVQEFTTNEGLLHNNIKALGIDDHGHVWIGTSRGLNKWRPKKGGFIAFTERAGFTGLEVKPNAVWTTRTGDLWFGTVNGATRVGSEKGAERSIAPLVALRGWKVNLEDRSMTESRLSHNDRNVRIAFGSVSLSDPAAVRYQYRLNGLDDDWQPITTTAEAYYPALPPGNYIFQVKAMDRSGLWSDPPARLEFAILPPWYRSWWFYTALALIIGIVLFSYIKVRERQLRLRNQILERKVEERTAEVVAQSKEIEGQKGRIEDLLLNILPKEISEELKEKGKATARRHEKVTVMFTDMKGFTQAAEKMTPEELVNELDECFIGFDEIVGRYGIEKIKTIGDSYMCAAGVPTSDAHHALKCTLAGLEVRELMNEWRLQREAQGKIPWILRIGVHTGPVVAGVVGKRKFAYDIWGDTVNTASRMESSGEPGEVNVSGATYALVKDRFVCEHRGQVAAKNKGAIDMYFVRRIKEGWCADPHGQLPNARFLKEIGLSVPEQELA